MFDEQVAAITRRSFAQFYLMWQLYLFLDQEALFTVTLVLVKNYCNVFCIGLLLKKHPEAVTAHFSYTHVTPLLFKLHCFQILDPVRYHNINVFYNCHADKAPRSTPGNTSEFQNHLCKTKIRTYTAER